MTTRTRAHSLNLDGVPDRRRAECERRRTSAYFYGAGIADHTAELLHKGYDVDRRPTLVDVWHFATDHGNATADYARGETTSLPSVQSAWAKWLEDNAPA